MAILLVLVSLMMVPFFQFQKIVTKQEERTEVKAGVDGIAQALVEYARMNGHYPAPANSELPLTDVSAGQSVIFDPLLDILATTCLDNPLPTSDWYRFGIRCVNGTRDSYVGTYEDRILIGSVPFTDLGLKPDQALDEYGNKFLYAVTYGLTKPDTFADDKGSIRLMTQFQKVVGPNYNAVNYTSAIGTMLGNASEDVTTQSRVHFVVISHGPNRLGAIGSNGALVTCGGNSTIPKSCALAGQLERANFFPKVGGTNGSLTEGAFRVLVNDANPPNVPENSEITRRVFMPGVIELNGSNNLSGPIGAFDDTIAFATTVMNDTYWTPFNYRGTAQNAYLGLHDGTSVIGIGEDPTYPADNNANKFELGLVQIAAGDNLRANQLKTPLLCNSVPGKATTQNQQKKNLCISVKAINRLDPSGLDQFLPITNIRPGNESQLGFDRPDGASSVYTDPGGDPVIGNLAHRNFKRSGL